MFYKFTMMNGVKTVDCEISNIALNDLTRWENAQLPDRDAQFLSFRDLIEKGSIGHIRTKRIQPGAGFLQACFRAGAKGEEMIGKNSDRIPDMRKRMVLQHLSLTDWRMVARLPIPASEMTLSRLVHQGWIEIRGENQQAEVRLTEAGLKATRSPI
jgi:hypothetical protein